MKRFKLLLLSLLMCFVISNTAYAEEEYIVISGGYTKADATTITFDTNYVTSVNGLNSDDAALYFTFTTPEQKGIFYFYNKYISAEEALDFYILDTLNNTVADCFENDYVLLSPATTYYLRITNYETYTNSGNVKFGIKYIYDFGGDSMSTATDISCDKAYSADVSGYMDKDWFKFNTGNYTEYLISCFNIDDTDVGCHIITQLYNSVEEQLVYEYGYIGEQLNTPISLQKNKDYYLCIYHEPDCDYKYEYYSDAYQFNISPVRTPLSSTSIKLSATSYTYDGKAKTPSVTVTYAGKTLTKGTDYTVSYSNNTAMGVGKVTITGINNYKGTVTKTFTIKPKKLTGLKQSWRTTSSVTLTWKALSGVTGYQIYRKDSANGTYKYVGSTTSTKYINKGLTAGKTYYYIVRGYKKSGTTTVTGINSDILTTTTTPGQVKGLKVDKNSTNYITLKWNKLNGATGYYIYRKDASNGSFKFIGGTTKTSYTNKSLTSGKNYYYVVVGYKKFNSQTLKGAKSATLQATTRPKAPTLKGTAGTKSAKLTWSKVTNASGYEVYMATSKNGTYKKIATIGAKSSSIATIGSTSITYNKSSLTKGKTYYFKVRSYTTGKSGAKVYSYKYSSVISVKAK